MYTLIQNLERKLLHVQTETERLDLLQIIAWEYFHHDLPQSEDKFKATTPLAQHLDYQTGQINALTLAACKEYRQGDFDRALEKALHTVIYYQEHHLPEWLWRTQTLVNAIYSAIGEYVLLLESAQKLYDWVPHDSRGAVMAMIAMGLAHLKTNDYHNALMTFEQATIQAEALDDTYNQVVLWDHRATGYLALKQYDQARDAIMRALHLSQTPLNLNLQAYAYQRFSELTFQVGDYRAAYQAITTSLQLMPADRYLHKIILSIQLGKITFYLQQPARALNLLRAALDDAYHMNAHIQIKDCQQELARIYKRMGQAGMALACYEQFYEAEKNLFNEDSDMRLRTLEVVHRTRQAQAEAELQRGLREQERAHYAQLTKIKDEVIAAASHDLKNPLTSMTIVLELLQRYLGHDEKVMDYIERMRFSTDKMRSLITDVLDLARFETGHGIEPKTVPPLPFIENTLRQHEVMAFDKNISLKFDAKLSDIVATFDPTQIRRVMDNLISNAIKYTPKGGAIEVTVEQEADAMVIRVVDTGPGISQEDLPHVFERFYRVKQGAQIEQEGTGLGLSIVKSIIEQHGGKIWVASEPQKGSVFSFSLPLVPLRVS